MATTSNCFSGILRRLLCNGEHPSDAIVSGEFNHYQDSKTENSSCAKPGIVARLMGLDSLPQTTVPKRRTLESILHSRSLNSINSLSDQTHQHRRVKTSVSFRELTTAFLDEPSYDLFLSCLEGVEIDENGMTKSDMCLEENIRTERNRVKERSKEVESMKYETENTRLQVEGSSMELPVSSSSSSSRRRRQDDEYPVQIFSSADTDEEEEEDKTMKLRRRESVKVIDQIWQIDCDSDWRKGFVWFEEIEVICNEFGQELLDDMFEKVVDELNMD